MNKCSGCGKLIDSGKTLCERCFRIRHYNEYKVVTKNNDEFINILENINQTNDLVLLVVDLFNIPDLSVIRKYLNNDIILILTKRDILPKNIMEEKLLDYDFKINCKEKLIISSLKNYNFDYLLETIRRFQKSKRVYVVGFTNAGKSTMINKLLYNYSTNKTEITTSSMPSTTLDTIEIDLDGNLTLIDTPGLLIENDLINYLPGNEIKKVVPKKEIKPVTFQIKGKQYLIIDKYLKIEANNIDLTFFISNDLKINRFYNDIKVNNLVKHEIDVNHNDIVITGLGFIKTNKKGKVIVYTIKDVLIYTRASLI